MEKCLKNKIILITGGTGFLGKCLIREILKYKPKRIRIFSRDELKHYNIQKEFNIDSKGPLRNLIGDVRDCERLKRAMQNCDIVIHAAALKRIDILEYNVQESINTNILGTLNVIKAALENNVEKVIFISTDKACSPVNTYGACKFVSERMFIESNYSRGTCKTIFSCVRYGNVINSTGSVIPFFLEKIKEGGDIPITDERMTRFLITSKQAVELVFKAIKYGVGGEVFVPKIPSFRIVDLANELIKKYGKNNKIKIIGVRPGEKIHELMINQIESSKTYDLGNFFIINSQIEKYSDKKNIYIKKAKKVNFEEYSSENCVLEKEKLRDYFNKIDVTNLK